MGTKRYRVFPVCIATLTFLVTAACAPVISQQALDEVDDNVRFVEIQADPDAYRGRAVLLGGYVIETLNLPEKTLIMVLQSPLGYRKKPAAESASKGRFIVSVPGFLDPAIYRPGRKVTVVGLIAGKEVRPLGEIKYTYPVITKREIYIWSEGESGWTEPRVHFGVGIG
ncbi:MAG: Slp family lipoprotein, partial [Deltaproteobacteria bacterium]|nr:Slp family lipoprotein [Deltaproteobacteria bacterium]